MAADEPVRRKWPERIGRYIGTLEPWQEAMVSGEVPIFISDGEPNTITIPADELVNLDEVWAAENGLEVRTYDASGS